MTYFLSLLAGLVVGILYALVGIRSPAPPLIALLGLLGMVAGEQGMNLVRRMSRETSAMAIDRPHNRPDR